MYDKNVISILQQMTQVPYISLAPRANKAIYQALQFAKEKGYTTVYIPDEGGWITYAQFAKKLKLHIEYIKTEHGLIKPESLILSDKSVILLHTLAGYHSLQKTAEIRKVCDAQGALFIEDMCGKPNQKGMGHIILGSFGKAKPLNYGIGGFIGTENQDWFKKLQFDTVIEDKKLCELVENVQKRLEFLYNLRNICKNRFKLEGFHTIADSHGIILLVPYSTDLQQKRIEMIAKDLDVEIECCPRYIRTMSKAISLEIKRKSMPL